MTRKRKREKPFPPVVAAIGASEPHDSDAGFQGWYIASMNEPIAATPGMLKLRAFRAGWDAGRAALKAEERDAREKLAEERKAALDADNDIGSVLMGSACCEGRHDECDHKGSKNPMEVCGCPCHGQHGPMCGRCWRERSGEPRGMRLPKLVREVGQRPCGFCEGRKAREKLQAPRGALACQSSRDGECFWKACPQRDATTRLPHCVLDLISDDDDEVPINYTREVADPHDEARRFIAEMNRDSLPLSEHARRVMRRLCVTTLAVLATCTAAQVSMVKGAGQKVMRELDTALATVGLTFNGGRWRG